jgi:hypothetical protein
MVKNKLIIVPFLLAWDWSADYQRQTCLVLAKSNKVVAYMHKDARFFLKTLFRKKTSYLKIKNVQFYFPAYFLPFSRFSLIEKINQIISFKIFLWSKSSYKDKILWIFDPDFHFYPKVERRILSIYDCVDYHWSSNKLRGKRIRRNEKKLIKAVDLFVVNSHTLYKVHSKVRKADRVVSQGFRIQDFIVKRRPPFRFPSDKPIIGLAGAINERLNFNLLEKLIKKNPQWNFVLWGPRQQTGFKDLKKTKELLEKLFAFPNVISGKLKTPKKVPAIIDQFTIAMIPYDTSQDSNKYCYPMKLFEYFYLGKPVVSTPIEEMKKFPKFVKIGRTAKEWEKHIRVLLSKPWPERYKEQQKRLAQENSWEKKLDKIAKIY